MTLSKYKTDFSDAMALKLRLNRKARQSVDVNQAKKSLKHEPDITPSNGPYKRSAEIQDLIAKHPGLTREKAEQGLRELGF